MFGGRGDRRNLESPERRRNKVLPREYHSETRYRRPGHMMPRMIKSRERRFNSLSIDKIMERRKRLEQESSKIYRKIDITSII
jgi:hypothetical protein